MALAPWLPSGEPVAAARGRRIAIAHAPRDRWTSPRETREWAARAEAVAERVVYVSVRRAGHFMLRRAGTWHAVARALVVDALQAQDLLPASTTASVPEAGANLLASIARGDLTPRV